MRQLDELLRQFRIVLRPRAEIARLERLAEEAYSAMYDAKRYEVRECYDEAFINLQRAIRIAKRMRMSKTAARLRARQDHIYHVYDHQFR